MNWIQSLLLRPRRRIVITPVLSTSMTLADWTASPECVATARRTFDTPQFQTMLSILRNESPASYGLATGSTHDDQIGHAYTIKGYNLALNNLEALARMAEKRTPLEATFAPEPPRPQSEPLDAQLPLQ